MFDPDGYTFVKIIAIAGTLYFAVRAAILIGVADKCGYFTAVILL